MATDAEGTTENEKADAPGNESEPAIPADRNPSPDEAIREV